MKKKRLGITIGLLLSLVAGTALAGWLWSARVSVSIETISLDPAITGVEAVWSSPIGIGDCSAKLAGQKVKVEITEGHPEAVCLVRTQISSGRLPLVLTDVILNEAQGVRLRYQGEPNVVVDGTAEFVMEIALTTDLPEGKTLSAVSFEYQFSPDYLAP